MLSSTPNTKRRPLVVTAALAVVADVVSFQQHVLQSAAVALSSSSSSTLVRIKTSMSSRKSVVPAAGSSIRGSRRTTRNKTPPSLLQRYFYAKKHHSSSLLPRTSRGPYDLGKMTSTPGQFLSVKENKNYSRGQRMSTTTLLSTSDSSFPGTKASDESTEAVVRAVFATGGASCAISKAKNDSEKYPACVEELESAIKSELAEQPGIDTPGMGAKIKDLVDARITQCEYSCDPNAKFGDEDNPNMEEVNAYVLAVNDVALLLDEAKAASTTVAPTPPATLALFAEMTAADLLKMKDAEASVLTTEVTEALNAIVGQNYGGVNDDQVEITETIVTAVDTDVIVAAVKKAESTAESIQKAITDAVTKAIAEDAAGTSTPAAAGTFQATATEESTKAVQAAVDSLGGGASTPSADHIVDLIKTALTSGGAGTIGNDALTAAADELQALAALVAAEITSGDKYAKAVDDLAKRVDEAKKEAAEAPVLGGGAAQNDANVTTTSPSAPSATDGSC
ncbi:unnamed protein product [Amoebophrya sp. A120]|nr:unnamed protein product [Amoebophrya sp. A120]|eukprot:GSA120T00013972001.1